MAECPIELQEIIVSKQHKGVEGEEEEEEQQQPWTVRVWDSVSLAFYSLDLGTDIYTFIQHINNGYYVWAGLTGGFTAMPMLFSILIFVLYVNKTKWSVITKNWVTLLAIVLSPSIPFCWMAWNICGSHKYAYEGVGRLKLFEAFGESLPQAGLQMFVVFYGLHEGTPIEVYQWITIAVSLGFLSFAVTTSYLFDGKSTSTKIFIFIYVMLAVASRFMVCCIFLLLNIYYWFMPLVTELGIIFILSCLIFCCYSFKDLKHICRFLITFASIINLSFAIGGFIAVESHLPIRSVTLFLAVMNVNVNAIYIVFVYTDLFKDTSWSFRVTFFIYFMLGIASRFMVCYIFFLLNLSYSFMPFGTELGIIFLLGWFIVCCKMYYTLGKANVCRFLITFASLINLCFAIRGFTSVTTHLPIRIVALVLAVINFSTNAIYCYFAGTNQA